MQRFRIKGKDRIKEKGKEMKQVDDGNDCSVLLIWGEQYDNDKDFYSNSNLKEKGKNRLYAPILMIMALNNKKLS